MATLEIDSLTKTYGDVRALRGTSFDAVSYTHLTLPTKA